MTDDRVREMNEFFSTRVPASSAWRRSRSPRSALSATWT